MPVDHPDGSTVSIYIYEIVGDMETSLSESNAILTFEQIGLAVASLISGFGGWPPIGCRTLVAQFPRVRD